VCELPDIVASVGYDWMELSPKADFILFFRYPRVDDAGVKELKKIASDAGVGIASEAGRRTRLEANHPDQRRPRGGDSQP
jgi:sugar phosphate isomerase/epimerase